MEESLKFILCHKIATLNLQYYKFGYLIDLQFFFTTIKFNSILCTEKAICVIYMYFLKGCNCT